MSETLTDKQMDSIAEAMASGKPFRMDVQISHRSMGTYVVVLEGDFAFKTLTWFRKRRYEALDVTLKRTKEAAIEMASEIKRLYPDALFEGVVSKVES